MSYTVKVDYSEKRGQLEKTTPGLTAAQARELAAKEQAKIDKGLSTAQNVRVERG